MKFSPIIVVAGEPRSVFLELFFKIYKSKFINKYKRPLLLIASKKLVLQQMMMLGYKIKVRDIAESEINKKNLNNKKINLINVDYQYKNKFNFKTKKYISKCF